MGRIGLGSLSSTRRGVRTCRSHIGLLLASRPYGERGAGPQNKFRFGFPEFPCVGIWCYFLMIYKILPVFGFPILRLLSNRSEGAWLPTLDNFLDKTLINTSSSIVGCHSKTGYCALGRVIRKMHGFVARHGRGYIKYSDNVAFRANFSYLPIYGLFVKTNKGIAHQRPYPDKRQFHALSTVVRPVGSLKSVCWSGRLVSKP